MARLQQVLIVLLFAGIAAAVSPDFTSTSTSTAKPVHAPMLCFTAGSVTYRVSPGAVSPDYRVKIDPRAFHPDLRIQLVDSVETADFALVDDVGSFERHACKSAGIVKTVAVVSEESPADVTMSLSGDATGADLKLFVHSARFGHQEAAALFAAMRLNQSNKLAQIH